MKIVFYGNNAANFRQGFEALLEAPHEIIDVTDALDRPGERAHFASADVIVGIRLAQRTRSLSASGSTMRRLPASMRSTARVCRPARRCAIASGTSTPSPNT